MLHPHFPLGGAQFRPEVGGQLVATDTYPEVIQRRQDVIAKRSPAHTAASPGAGSGAGAQTSQGTRPGLSGICEGMPARSSAAW
ncbi:MAG TPA: hypothetical protein VF897_07405 [Roseiflexaceae bacterium]